MPTRESPGAFPAICGYCGYPKPKSLRMRRNIKDLPVAIPRTRKGQVPPDRERSTPWPKATQISIADRLANLTRPSVAAQQPLL
jgi:hypothetical protein